MAVFSVQAAFSKNLAELELHFSSRIKHRNIANATTIIGQSRKPIGLIHIP